jgi:hypothetical protein
MKRPTVNLPVFYYKIYGLKSINDGHFQTYMLELHHMYTPNNHTAIGPINDAVSTAVVLKR